MSRKKKPKPQPICPYCGTYAELVPDSEVYARSYGSFVWRCAPCKAWVGVHRGSPQHAPLGRLANAELRILKMQAHDAFDRIWRAAMTLRGYSKSKARFMTYQWLAAQMEMPMSLCHIGMFGEDQCREAITICSKIGREKQNVHTA